MVVLLRRDKQCGDCFKVDWCNDWDEINWCDDWAVVDGCMTLLVMTDAVTLEEWLMQWLWRNAMRWLLLGNFQRLFWKLPWGGSLHPLSAVALPVPTLLRSTTHMTLYTQRFMSRLPVHNTILHQYTVITPQSSMSLHHSHPCRCITVIHVIASQSSMSLHHSHPIGAMRHGYWVIVLYHIQPVSLSQLSYYVSLPKKLVSSCKV